MNKIPVGYKQTEAGVIPEDWVIIISIIACANKLILGGVYDAMTLA